MDFISSKELTDKYKISYQTLNFYTNLGLFRIRRRIGNRRFFDENETKERFGKISQMKEEGYPLRMIIKQLNDETLFTRVNGRTNS